MNERKVAIATVYGEFNLGNKLQNYAVTKIYKELGFYPITQVFNKKTSLNFKMKNFLKMNILRFIPFVGKFKSYNRQFQRNTLFKSFSNNYLHLYKIDYSNDITEINNNYLFFSVGSDQVWNDDYVKGNELLFLLGRNIEIPKISLSASFGKSSVNEKEIFKNLLPNFKAISVREESAVNIIEDLIGKESTLLSDPTLALSKDEWSNVSNSPSFNVPKKYAVAYFLGGMEKFERNIKDYCKKNNLELVNVLDRNSVYFESGPREFINLVENSEIVFTDSFHASVFSIIFNRQFYVFERQKQKSSMSSRIDTLLNKFDLHSCFYKGEINYNDIDWNSINKKLSIEKENIYSFLTNTLKEINIL